MPTRGKKDPNGRALRGRRAHTTFISDPIAQLWSNYNIRSGVDGAITPEQPAVQNCLYDRFETIYKKTSIKPSLLIVPARFKSGKLYSQIPTSGAGDFTVTRATNATRVNASGLIESVASGIPRLDYFSSDGTVGCPALLVEPAAQNLALQSENFLTTWTNTSLVITSGFTSPSNNSNGTLIEASANTGRLRQPFAAITSGTTHTFSLFAEAGNLALASGVSLVFQEGTATNFVSGVVQSFRLDTGTLGASGTLGAGFTLTRASIEDYGNGWYRCSMTVTVSYTPASANISIRPTSTIVSNLPATVSGGTAYIWGAQLETGSVATSYIPTTTAAVTRNADVVSVSGAVSGSIGQTEGTMYAEFFVDFNNRNADILSVDGGSTSNGFFMSIRSSSVVQLIVRTASANALIFQRTGAYPTGVNKLAIAYKNGDFAISLNGTAAQTDSSTITMPSVSINRFSIARSSLNNLDQQLRIRAAALYTTRLSNAELAALTSL